MGIRPRRAGFETVSSDLVYRGRILALRRDRVRMPGGSTAWREVVEHQGAVAAALVDEDLRILLVHQYRHAVGVRMWELPAGLLDVVGEDPVAAAARELREEVGYAAAHWETLVDVANSPGFCDEIVRVYLARDLSEVPRPAPGDDEEADMIARWFDLSEAAGMVLAGEILNSTAAAGVLAAAATLGVAPVSRATRAADADWPLRPTAFHRRAEDGSASRAPR